MVNRELIDPKSIVVVGGSNELQKPGGKIIKNLVDGGFKGPLYILNPKEDLVQGLKSYRFPDDLPEVELAIMAIAARHIPETMEYLCSRKGTKAFIIISAGFSEENHQGKLLEDKLVSIANQYQASLIGPNCIGVLTPSYHGVFTLPVPKLEPRGCDFITGSGATACFIMENGIQKGLSFARVFSVGNSAQMGVEDILQYMDESFDENLSPRVKLLYMESINKPGMLFKHALSLIRKGCKIAAIKAGASEAGSRAASSHTGALASSDLAVETLLKKAGIVRCQGREELINVASVFMHPELKGRNIGIITHAGGPAVMLTDALSREGFNVPHIENEKSGELLGQLFAGSSVANPIDFLATGTAEQLGKIIDYTDRYFSEVDGMAVIFGTPGLSPIFDVYEVLDEKMKSAGKPIFPILPSTYTAAEEVKAFINKGRINFPDEVQFARALGIAYSTDTPGAGPASVMQIDRDRITNLLQDCKPGYLSPDKVAAILQACGIPTLPQKEIFSKTEVAAAAEELGFPLVMKVIGPLHKSDVGGVKLNIPNGQAALKVFDELMMIRDARGVLMQPMIRGQELFAGVKYEDKFGHLILCGMGGIFIEILKDFSTGMAPLTRAETVGMIEKLRIYPVLKGMRGQKGINIELFADILLRISSLCELVPAVREMDLNPLLASGPDIYAVDARLRIG